MPVVGPDVGWRELRAAFRAELEDRARAIGAMLDGLELGGDQAPLPATLEELRREAHGLKGAARAVELTAIEQLANGLEHALDAAHAAGRPLKASWFDAVDRAVDALDALVHSDPESDNPPATYLADILRGLGAASTNLPARTSALTDSLPTAAGAATFPDETFALDWKELWLAFGLELEEREEAIRAALSRLTASADDINSIQTLDELRREVHSLKGAARAVELASVERLAHAVETSVATAKSAGKVPSQAWLDAVDRAVDAVRALHQSALTDDAPSVDLSIVLDALAIVWEDDPPPEECDVPASDEPTTREPLVEAGLKRAALLDESADDQADPQMAYEAAGVALTDAGPTLRDLTGLTPEPSEVDPSHDEGEGKQPVHGEDPLSPVSPASPGADSKSERLEPTDTTNRDPVAETAGVETGTDRPDIPESNPWPMPLAPVQGRLLRESRGRPLTDTVRVSVSKLDGLLAQAGELTVAEIRSAQRLAELREIRNELQDWRREWRSSKRSRAALKRSAERARRAEESPRADLEAILELLDRAEQRAGALQKRIDAITLALSLDTTQRGNLVDSIEDEVMRIRLVSVDTIFGPFERMVRDLLRDQHKEARLVIEGRDTEIDRKVLEQIREPLIHLLRNAVDHGIEPPDARPRIGKPRMGMIRLSATPRGDVVEIELADDGAGLDPSRLRWTAVRSGLLTEEQAGHLDDRQAIELIFRPGFTTRTTVTETSGRGVGMDAVRDRIQAMNGHIEVHGVPGRGARFNVRVPLTLATTRAIVIEHAGDLFAVPSSVVERTARLQPRDLHPLEGLRVVEVAGTVVPLADLGEVLGRAVPGSSKGFATDWRPYFVLNDGERRAAFIVDRLVDEQQIVIKRLGWPLGRPKHVSGATVLPNGEAIALLNAFDLLRAVTAGPAAGRDSTVFAAGLERRRHVLVVDDSLTTRTLQRSILEAAGFEVSTATDGYEALRQLAEESVDLVVSDVDMPRLDGLGLIAEIRRDHRLRQVPVILVTAHESEDRRQQGLGLGADAYLVKSGFDQSRLLETIRGLL